MESVAATSPLDKYGIIPWRDRALAHGFLGREGGVSRGPYASLNFSYLVGDDRAAVDINWNRLCQSLAGDVLFAGLHQVHGADVRVVTRGDAIECPRADGHATAERGVVLGVLSADCVPLLMVDRAAAVCGAFHAGWRGTIAGIAGGGVDAMVRLGAKRERIEAALGPSIGVCCFEVDSELADRFAAEIPASALSARAARPGKSHLDLRAIIRLQLERSGLDTARIGDHGPCTRCASDRYFSRRAAGGQTTGLQLSFIGFAQ
jgi:YfiH family protein